MLLFSTDIDGTVYDGSPSTLRFAEYWKSLPDQTGYPKLAYNTGRSLDDTLDLIKNTDLPEPDFIISGVGTRITDGQGRNELTSYSRLLSDNWNFQIAAEVTASFEGPVMQPEECQNPYKCSWYWNDADKDAIGELLERLAERNVKAQAIYSSNRDLDLLPVKANKANALIHLITHLDLPWSEVLVAGDSGNDAAMLSLSDISAIAVANSEPALITALENKVFFHSSQNCADGVIEGIRHFNKNTVNQ